MILTNEIQSKMNTAEHLYSQARMSGDQTQASKFMVELDRLWGEWENLYTDAMSGLEI